MMDGQTDKEGYRNTIWEEKGDPGTSPDLLLKAFLR